MKKIMAGSAAVLALAITVPAFAGGSHCGGEASATTADAHMSCSGAKSAAWAGAWLRHSDAGELTVAEVTKGSPAQKAGLKVGDVVTAVNGYDLSNPAAREECAAHHMCSVGSAVTYTVQRGATTKTIKLKLAKMPTSASDKLASQNASFDPALAAVVMPASTTSN